MTNLRRSCLIDSPFFTSTNCNRVIVHGASSRKISIRFHYYIIIIMKTWKQENMLCSHNYYEECLRSYEVMNYQYCTHISPYEWLLFYTRMCAMTTCHILQWRQLRRRARVVGLNRSLAPMNPISPSHRFSFPNCSYHSIRKFGYPVGQTVVFSSFVWCE